MEILKKSWKYTIYKSQISRPGKLKMVGACEDDSCECGAQHTIPHFLQECPIFKPPTGLDALLALDHATTKWLGDADIPV